MPAVENCNTSCCTTVTTVNTPGSAGQSAFTTTTANLTVPAISATVVVAMANTDWFTVGAILFISDGTDWGHFEVQSISSQVSATLVFLGQTNDASPGAVIGSGAEVVAGGTQQDFDTTALKALNTTLITTDAAISAFTDNSGGTASSTIAAGVGIQTIPIFVNLAQITATSIFSYTPGFAFKVLAIQFSVEIAVTNAAKGATLTPTVNGSGVTGGALVLTSANCTPKGTTVSGSAISGGNTGTNAQTLGITASSVTTFLEGTGWVLLRIQNMDTANAVASLADKTNDLMAALQT
jgi:hypothetical protein